MRSAPASRSCSTPWAKDQAAAPPGALAGILEHNGEFHFGVHNAAGAVSVQAGVGITEALILLRAYAFSTDRPLDDVAADVLSRTIRFTAGGVQ